VHVALLLLFAFLYLGGASGPERGNGELELAVMTNAELSRLSQQAPTPVPTPRTDAQSPEQTLNPLSDVVGVPDASTDTATDIHITGGAGADLGAGMAIGGGAGLGGASFFGVEARGARFVYIVDVSGSMSGEKLDTLQIELTDSLNGLSPRASFAVLLFSTDVLPIGGKARWWDAKDAAKAAAAREIRAISARGGTNPLPAFEMAFALKPRPDAIYFMTDGLFVESAASEIAELNRQADGAPTPIHCISFVSREAAQLMRAIARQSGGSYTHIEGPGR